MAEPSTSAGVSLTVISVSLLGPLLGPYALIVVCAVAGSMWPLSDARTDGYRAGLSLLVRCVATAVVLTVFISQVIERVFDIPATWSMGAVAFAIAALGNGWRPVFGGLGDVIGRVLGKAGGAQ